MSPNNFVRGCSSDIVTYLTFDVNLRTLKLWVAPYSNQQGFFHDTVLGFRDKGWTFKVITDWLNDNGSKSGRGSAWKYWRICRFHLP